MSLYGLVMRSVPALGAVAVGTLAEGTGLKLALALAAGLFLPLWLVLRPGRSGVEP